MEITSGSFCWNDEKEAENILKHGVSFSHAAWAFQDPCRVVFRDAKHSGTEERWFCIGKVDEKMMTVRFTYRGDKIRIIGSGYWRSARRYYHEEKF